MITRSMKMKLRGHQEAISGGESLLTTSSSGGNQYGCTADGCGRLFLTRIGLAIHQGKMHRPRGGLTESQLRKRCLNGSSEPAWQPIRGDVWSRACYKRWSQEEMRILAHVAFNYRHLLCSRATFVAEALMKSGIDRNYNAIQRKLHCPKYQAIQAVEWEKLTNRDRMLNEIPEPLPVGDSVEGVNHSGRSDDRHVFAASLKSALKPEKGEFRTDMAEELLDEIALKAMEGEAVRCLKEELNEYFLGMYERNKKPIRRRKAPWTSKRNARLERAWQFLRTQHHWRSNRSRTARDLLNGRTGGGKKPLDIPGFFQHWSQTFEPAEGDSASDGMVPFGEKFDIWFPVSESEIKKSLTGMKGKTSPGPDGVSVSLLKALPTRVLVKWYNLFMLCGCVPACLKRSTTVFIPKKDEPVSASDFRPISMSSVITRLFNKILTQRLLDKVAFDYRQKAFLPLDGCAENIVLLEAILRTSNMAKKNLFLAMLDMKNAYGSVSHDAVIRALECSGADERLVEYVRDLYTDYSTTLTSRGEEVEVVVRRGILQGDPLSPLLFNMVIDQILRVIPGEVGFQLTPTTLVNSMAFADDLNVITQSAVGMQDALTKIEAAAKPYGLEFNANKCSVLANVSIKGKGSMRMEVDTAFKFTIGGARVPMIRDESVRYLGAYFTSKGMTNERCQLATWLDRLKKAMLMPSQKLYVLRTHLIPRLIHRVTFSKISATGLEKLDAMIRKVISGPRGILKLPKGTTKDFLYASVADGGLGLLSLRRSIPSIVIQRFERLRDNPDPVINTAANMEANLNRIRNATGCLVSWEDILGEGRENIQTVNRNLLYQRVDASGLQLAREASYAHRWIDSGATEFLGNRQFIDALKLRINALPTKSHWYRGQTHSRRCRVGCKEPETNEHALQRCVSTRNERRTRHNDVVDTLADELRAHEFTVHSGAGATIHVGDNRWYPDMIAIRNTDAYVVDVQIIGDQVDFGKAYESKTKKYGGIPGFELEVLRKFPVCTRVVFGACIINRKGVIGPRTEEFRKDELLLPCDSMQKCVLTAIRGSLRIFYAFVKGNRAYTFKTNTGLARPRTSAGPLIYGSKSGVRKSPLCRKSRIPGQVRAVGQYIQAKGLGCWIGNNQFMMLRADYA